ncbi:MAG: peptidase C13 [Alphaproteobacteria bacterium]|nr:peptidase C13 [Alphaproteobacteria bacterium]MBL7099257.1 peptidase C13 [Alphaproteobacteria bacterium]
MKVFRAFVAAICAALIVSPASAAGFGDWAAIVVAADWHSHSGAPSEVFDNGRRDVAADLVRLGFSQNNIIQFSVRNDTHPGTDHADKQTIANELWDLSNRTTGGCFVYFTSHGSPDGMVLGDDMISPSSLSGMIDNACGTRPTVVFTVACFSGVFVDALSGPNRFVMTAARPDRPSFGCGDNDRYTFFDNCWLDSVGSVGDFGSLATAIRACVSRKEHEINGLPSEPQLYIGPTMAAAMPHWR